MSWFGQKKKKKKNLPLVGVHSAMQTCLAKVTLIWMTQSVIQDLPVEGYVSNIYQSLTRIIITMTVIIVIIT